MERDPPNSLGIPALPTFRAALDKRGSGGRLDLIPATARAHTRHKLLEPRLPHVPSREERSSPHLPGCLTLGKHSGLCRVGVE